MLLCSSTMVLPGAAVSDPYTWISKFSWAVITEGDERPSHSRRAHTTAYCWRDIQVCLKERQNCGPLRIRPHFLSDITSGMPGPVSVTAICRRRFPSAAAFCRDVHGSPLAAIGHTYAQDSRVAALRLAS